MKSTGIVRSIDTLGRIVLPKELRKSLKIDESTPLEIFVDGDYILLKKYRAENACEFCGEIDSRARRFAGVCICSACRKKIARLDSPDAPPDAE